MVLRLRSAAGPVWLAHVLAVLFCVTSASDAKVYSAQDLMGIHHVQLSGPVADASASGDVAVLQLHVFVMAQERVAGSGMQLSGYLFAESISR
jgi:hypothetical protein